MRMSRKLSCSRGKKWMHHDCDGTNGTEGGCEYIFYIIFNIYQTQTILLSLVLFFMLHSFNKKEDGGEEDWKYRGEEEGMLGSSVVPTVQTLCTNMSMGCGMISHCSFDGEILNLFESQFCFLVGRVSTTSFKCICYLDSHHFQIHFFFCFPFLHHSMNEIAWI